MVARRVLVVVVIVATGWFLWFLLGQSMASTTWPELAPRDASERVAQPDAGVDVLASPAGEGNSDEARSGVAAAADEPSLDAEPQNEIATTRMLDVSGQPVAGVEFELPDGSTVQSDALGYVAHGVVERELLERVRSAHVVLFVGSARTDDSELGSVAIVSPSQVLDLLIVDSSGERVPEAYVNVASVAALKRFPYPFTGLDQPTWHKGRASPLPEATHRLVDIPIDCEVELSAWHGARRGWVDLEPGEHGLVRITLEDAAPDETTRVPISGLVLNAHGVPVAGAKVFFNHARSGVVSDESGRFELSYPVKGGPLEVAAAGSDDVPALLCARHPQFGLAFDAGLERAIAGSWPDPPPPFELVLAGERGALRLHLVDDEGGDVAGWVAQIVDPTSMGWRGASDSYAEEIEATSDTDGHIVFATLDPERSYQIVLIHRAIGVVFRAGPFTPGGGEIDVPVDGRTLARNVRGVARSLRGAPLAGVDLTLQVQSFDLVVDGATYRRDEPFGTVRTDTNGRFEFDRVPLHGALVLANAGEELRLDNTGVWLDPTTTPIELVFARLVPVVPSIGENAPDDAALRALDGDGRELMLTIYYPGGSVGSSTAFKCRNLATGVVWVNESVVQLAVSRYDRNERAFVNLATAVVPAWSGPEAGPLHVVLGP